MLDGVIKAGAVAGAIAAIIGVVRLVVPHDSPPGHLRAALRNAQVDNPVLLASYMRQLKRSPVDPGVDRVGDGVPARGGGGASTGVAPMAVVTLVATLQQSDTPTSETPTPQPSEPAPGTGTGTTTTPQGTGPIGGQHATPVTSKSQIPALPRHPDPNPSCRRTASCPVAKPLHYLAPAIDTDQPTPGSQTLKALAAVRTVKPVPASFSGGGTDALSRFAPVGVRVLFDVEAEGYPSKRLILRWSLLDARHGTSVGTSWSQRLGMVLIPSALDAGANEDIWVPLPRRRGAFKVRLQLTEPEGTRLASLDSPAFR